MVLVPADEGGTLLVLEAMRSLAAAGIAEHRRRPEVVQAGGGTR